MELSDGTTLMHGRAPYDPAKARAYYLRTRKLKGRKKGAPKKPSGPQLRDAPSTFTVKTGKGKSVRLNSRQLAEQRLYARARVGKIKKKLAKLNSELKKKVAEAKRAERESKKAPSAAEKSKAARESKQYRDKNQQKLATASKKAESKKSAPDPNSVEGLNRIIESTQKSLKAAVARQRALATATKNR